MISKITQSEVYCLSWDLESISECSLMQHRLRIIPPRTIVELYWRKEQRCMEVLCKLQFPPLWLGPSPWRTPFLSSTHKKASIRPKLLPNSSYMHLNIISVSSCLFSLISTSSLGGGAGVFCPLLSAWWNTTPIHHHLTMSDGWPILWVSL